MSFANLMKYAPSPAYQAANALKNNKAAKNFAANLGFGTSDATKAAQENLDKSIASYQGLNPPTLVQEHPQYANAYQQAPTAMRDIAVNPAYNEEQVAQMGALRNLAANGGRNAASDAALAQIQQQENANARGQNQAILQNANARGMGGSGASLIAQLNAQQNETNNQAQQDLGVRGQQANTAIQAGQGAANIGYGLQNQAFNEGSTKAQAEDAINRFNSGQNTGMSQYNAGIGNQAQQYNTGLQQTGYQNQYQKAAGVAGANMSGVNFNQAQANMGAQQAGNLTGGLIKLGTAAVAARGGSVPGVPVVNKDSTLNDFVPIKASPGEVVVPRSLVKQGSGNQIASFVKHPPQIQNGMQDKEAMLGALGNLRRRRVA